MSSLSPNTGQPGSPTRSRRGLAAFLGNRLITGFAVAVPLIITIWLLVLTYRFILFVGQPLIALACQGLNLALGRTAAAGDLIEPADWFVNVFGILTPILIFLGLGIMAANVFGARVIGWFEKLLLKFPFVSFLYSNLKQMVDSFRSFGGTQKFNRVVYVEYPAPGCRLVAFATGQYVEPTIGKSVTHVFIPTAPNPMTGFVIEVDSDRLIESHLTIEQATKVILTAGLVTPEKDKEKPKAAPASSKRPSAAAAAASAIAQAVAAQPMLSVIDGPTGFEDERY